MSTQGAIQDYYPEDVAHCYGCGRLNERGHRIRTFWEGDETVARFRPQPYHTAIEGYVYGGLIASLIDCHGTGSAAAARALADGKRIGVDPSEVGDTPRFVTASLHVDYLKPTPLGPELELRGTIREVGERKAVVDITLSAEGDVTARGTVIAVRMPEGMVRASADSPRRG